MKSKLAKYKDKRDFNKTTEPAGEVENNDGAKVKKKIFCVQHHLARRDHYDFRLEYQGVLLSWAVPKGPSFFYKDKRLAVKVEDHPLSYTDFEGIIPEGSYGAGTVMLWDKGTWGPETDDVEKSLENGFLKFELNGSRLKGKWALCKMKSAKGDNWILSKIQDEFAQNIAGIKNYKTSIKTGRTMKEIESEENNKSNKTKNPFSSASVQLLKLVDTAPEGKDWIYELKFDGYRMLCFIENGGIHFQTRNGQNYTEKLSQLQKNMNSWCKDKTLVLDGEVVVLDENGVPNFGLLQGSLKDKSKHNLSYILFDLLSLNGEDLRKKPLKNRRKMLKKLLKSAPKCLVFSKEIKGNGGKIFENACALGFEGIVAKKQTSSYSGTRNDDWKKIKCKKEQEFVVGGYEVSTKKDGISTLLLGVYSAEKLKYVGKTGTGFSTNEAKSILEKLQKLRSKSHFANMPKKELGKHTIFVKPQVVAQVQYAELTSQNLLRQASFKGLRDDKNPNEIVFEASKKISSKTMKQLAQNVEGVILTHPDKVLFEKTTKQALFDYYCAVSNKIMKYLEQRPVSLKRCPQNVNACFFERNYSKSMGENVAVIKSRKSEKSQYFYIKNALGLLHLVQLNTIEFHIWGAKMDNIDSPDIMTFDLDPDEGVGLSQLRRGVKDLKKVLDKLGLKSFLKTSGGKGYHVLVPLIKGTSWQTLAEFSKNVAVLMESRWNDRYTSNIRKSARKGKIFIDWVRNTKSSTFVAPYSVRAKESATISMPISFRDLNRFAPDEFCVENFKKKAPRRDPWKDFFVTKQELK